MSNELITDVVFEKDTKRIFLVKYDDLWVLPDNFNLAHFENGVEPVFEEREDGNCYFKPNAVIMRNI